MKTSPNYRQGFADALALVGKRIDELRALPEDGDGDAWNGALCAVGTFLNEAQPRQVPPLNRRGEPRPPGWYPGYWKDRRAWEAANPGVPFVPKGKP